MVNLGIIFALLSTLGFGLYQYFVKGSKNNIYSTLIYVHVTMFLLTLPLLIYNFALPSIKTFTIIIFAGLIGAINIPFLYKAIKLGKLSLVIPVANTYALPSVVFSMILFGEILSLRKYFFGLIILLGIIFIVLKRSEIKNLQFDKNDLKPIFYASIFSLGLGFWNNLLKPIESEIGPYLGFFYVETFILFFLIIYGLFSKVHFEKPKKISILISTGAFQFVGSLLFFIGIGYIGVSLTSMISASNPLITMILAMVFLKEKIEWNQLVGILITIIGLVGLGL